jgi:thiol:disulfide interchange protein DsbD
MNPVGRCFPLIITFVSMLLASPASGLEPPARVPASASDLVKVRATADVEAIRPGARFQLAFVFDIEPHWHIYWKNAGVTGMPTEIDVEVPEGFHVGAPLFPRPRVFRDQLGPTYGYDRKVVIFMPITAPDEIAVDRVRFKADIAYLVCRGMCLMGFDEKSVELPVTAAAPSPSPDGVLAEFRGRLPKPVAKLEGLEVVFADGVLSLEGRAPVPGRANLFPLPVPGVTFGEIRNDSTDERIRIRVPVTVEPANALGNPLRVAGLLVTGSKLSDPCYEFDIPATGPAGPPGPEH